MKYAVNYSPLLAELVQAGLVSIDFYKCPAWPDLLTEAIKTLPVYIHFPLSIGYGEGNVMDEETHQPADLERFARMMDETGTPFINTHFIAPAETYANIPPESRASHHIRRVLDGAIRDLEPLIHRFGAEKVLVENIINEHNWLTACALPDVISSLISETGCGFLFDLSHARLTAEKIGMDAHEYIAGLPMDKMCEGHVTGLKTLEGGLLEMILAVGDPYDMVSSQAGKRIDHLPMEEEDWPELAWLIEGIDRGKFRDPWVMAFEYGGVGHFWEELTDRDIYLTQLPLMASMLHEGGNHKATR
ncbi:MAG: DUF692 family protein [Anaerolineaceae bacterium]|nr:DUF692 family protein [Anaerolineaceae bacterium]